MERFSFSTRTMRSPAFAIRSAISVLADGSINVVIDTPITAATIYSPARSGPMVTCSTLGQGNALDVCRWQEPARLVGPERCIDAAEHEQLLVRSLLDDTAPVKNDERVHTPDRGQTVRD